MRTNTTLKLGALGLTGGLMVTACGGDGGEGEGGQIHFTIDPTAVAAYVADGEGFFEDAGLDVEVSTVGQDEPENLLMAGQTDVAWMSPLEAAELVAEGEDFQFLGTAGSLNMFNGVVVRAEDADQYQNLSDLEGQTLGQPGFGSGTWTTFQVFADMYYGIGDPQNTFEIATADSGALLAMLETGEIDAALLFAADSAATRFSDDFETVFAFTDVMEENDGQPLVITGAASTSEWLEENPEDAEALQEALDEAVGWMAENPDEFREGGTYEETANDNGWLRDDTTTDGILEYVEDSTWLLTSETYTEEWREAIHGLIENGEGVIVDTVPEIDDYLAPAE